MERTPVRLQQYICRSCRTNARRLLLPSLLGRASFVRSLKGERSVSYTSHSPYNPHFFCPQPRARSTILTIRRRASSSTGDAISKIDEQVDELLKDNNVPADEQVVGLLRGVEAHARTLVGAPDSDASNPKERTGSSTSAILSMSSKASKQKSEQRSTASDLNVAINALSSLAHGFVSEPNVFISSDALQIYVRVQSMLRRPQSFPDVFELFAHKPIPTPSKQPSTPPTYSTASPKAVAAAVPPATANLAIDTAITIRDLPLALSIIATTYQQPAYRRLKVFKQALGPLIGASLTPVAAYTLATNLSAIQTGLPPETFTSLAFAGLGSYALGVGTIGYVALTSANDQMQRVTWAVGMPLWERWVREEERAAVDRVALAWGFKEKWRWGEEDGAVWEDLREWVGVRGMVLDKVGLMEGME